MKLYSKKYHLLVTWPGTKDETLVMGFYKFVRDRYTSKVIKNRIAIVKEEINAAAANRVLEVGSGTGQVLLSLARHFGNNVEIQGIDFDNAYSVIEYKSLARPMDASNLVYHDQRFTFVYSLHTLEHVENLDQVISELHVS